MTIQRTTPEEYFRSQHIQQQQYPSQYYGQNFTPKLETMDTTMVYIGLIIFGVVAICGIVAIAKK